MKAILLALATLAPLIGAASAITIPASEDSTLAKGKVTLAAGRAATLGVDFEDSALLKFNMPPGLKVSHVLSARLRLYVRSAVRVGHLQVKEALSTWSEDVVNEALTLSEGTVALPDMLPVNKSKQFVYFDVTELVKSWIGRESEIFGVAVTSCGDSKFSISSKEGSASGYPAELEIDINPALPLFVGGDPQTELWDGAKIAEGTVATAQLGDGSVSRAKLAQGAVGTGQIADGSVTTAKLAAGSVGANQIAEGSISVDKLSPDSSFTSALGPHSVGPDQLALGAIGSDQLAAGSVSTLSLVSGAVTSDKLNLEYASFSEESFSHAGSSLKDDWQLRKLTTGENSSNGAITLSENTITLQPGVYLVFGQCPASGANENQAAFCEVTGTERAVVLLGTSDCAISAFSNSANTHSFFQGFVKVEGSPRTYQLWHWTCWSRERFGLGKNNTDDLFRFDATAVNNTMPSVYSTVSILKIQ